MFRYEIVAQSMKGSDSGRRGKKCINLVFIDHLPTTSTVGIGGHTFEHDGCCAVGKWAVYDIRVSSHPSHVCCAPENLAFTIVKNIFERAGCLQQVAARCVQYTFWLAR